MAKTASLHHVRHHAKRHHEAHQTLKELLRYAPEGNGILKKGAILVILFFLMWNAWNQKTKILSWINPPETVIETTLTAYKNGINAALRIHEQARRIQENFQNRILSSASLKGIDATLLMGQTPELQKRQEEALKISIWLTNSLSKGQHLTKLTQSNARVLQKSILATYLLGEKTVEIESALASDTKILQRMQNALSVDIFQYLNQSVSRSDALDDYLKLLEILRDVAETRIRELGSKIGFLQGNYASTDARTQTKEEAFFENLQKLQGAEAEKSLYEFVGLQEGQAEVRAKIGAYSKLQEYYKFFLPRLERLIYEIKLNRDPLIAGVKVVDIQRMQLPLLIPEP